MIENQSAAFGELLRELRLAAGLSQEALAERAHMSREGVSALERGLRRVPYRDTVRLLADGLSLDSGQRARLEAAASRRSATRRFRNTQVTQETHRSNLPLSFTSFVGRDGEIAEISEQIEHFPLLTLVGPGGVGKTRTALQIGRALLGRMFDGVWFVDFAPLSEASSVIPAIAHVLGLQEPRGGPTLESVNAYLSRRRLLLIFDNCEHVIDEAARVCREILEAAPLVRILPTSREPLKLSSERVYRLRPLGTSSAVELFRERARAVDHRFELTDDTTTLVAEICARLDGIPLAIELAAAIVTILPLRALLEKLGERFSILRSSARDSVQRQQTLRALIDWSYDLLSPAEQHLFESLAAFTGGCTLATATSVCGVRDENEVLSLLTSLVDKSLVVADVDCDEPRYMMLESTLEYARERLSRRDDYTLLKRRHAHAFYDIAAVIERAWFTHREPHWVTQIEADLDNWRAALEWTLVSRHDVVLGQQLAGVLRPVWSLGFGLTEGRRWVRVAIESLDASSSLDILAQLEFADALIAHELAESRSAVTIGEHALGHFRELNDPLRIAAAECVVGEAMLYIGRQSEAEPLLHDALATSKTLGTAWLTASLLAILAHARSVSGRQAEARSYYAEALAAFRAIDDERGFANTSANLAEAEFLAGDRDEALRIAERGLAGGYIFDLNAFANVAAYLVALNRFDEALVQARKAVELARERKQGIALMWSLQHVAAVEALRATTASSASRAARLLGFVDARLAAFRVPRQFTEQQEYDRAQRSLLRTLGNELLSREMADGAATNDDEAIEIAIG